MSKVQIDTQRLKELERMESKLAALEAGGVDNWEWYGASLKDWYKEEDKQELIVNLMDTICEVFAVHGSVDYPAGMEAGASIYLEDLKYLEDAIKDYTENLSDLEKE